MVAGQEARDERRDAYACDITYCTNKELAFDYLRDRMVLGQSRRRPALEDGGAVRSTRRGRGSCVLRGLHFAIVDEADSVLIDEARTPLIISGPGRSEINADAIAPGAAICRDARGRRRLFVSARRATGLS